MSRRQPPRGISRAGQWTRFPTRSHLVICKVLSGSGYSGEQIAAELRLFDGRAYTGKAVSEFCRRMGFPTHGGAGGAPLGNANGRRK